MPRKVTAYGCEYGCRIKVTTRKELMARHERTCIYNPARRACPTCAHQAVDYDEPYLGHHFGEATYGSPHRVRYCVLEVLPNDKQCIVLCDKWEARGS